MALEAVIGLECHIQVASRSKMFCDCPAGFGAAPNSHVCPVCLALPGALPRANRAAVAAAVRLGLALGCDVRERSTFARKHYFYPDMPKNYQISQYDRPVCAGGALPAAGAVVPLTRIHLEEDTGKSFHPERRGDRRRSRVDFNRAGVPLLELVTEPALRSPAECGAFLTALRRLVRWLGVSDGDMEKGQLRCDANVSLRPEGATALGTKTELKNLNSIKGVERGVAAEIERQRRALEGGGRIEQATLLYDADHDRLAIMRTKEHAHDYRYFPDPDLPELVVDAAWRRGIEAELPELPWACQSRLESQYGLPAYDAAVLSDSRELAAYFEAAAAAGHAKVASNWIMTEVLRAVKDRELGFDAFEARVPPARLSDLIVGVGERALPGPVAKQAFEWMLDEPGTLAELLAAHGVRIEGAPEALAPLVEQVLERHADVVEQLRAGKDRSFGFLVGQVMKDSGGQAVPQTVNALLREALARRGVVVP